MAILTDYEKFYLDMFYNMCMNIRNNLSHGGFTEEQFIEDELRVCKDGMSIFKQRAKEAHLDNLETVSKQHMMIVSVWQAYTIGLCSR